MTYSNPLPEEGINTTQTHPLKELLLLTSGLLVLIIIGVITLGLLADKFAQYIPFEAEVYLADNMTTQASEKPKNHDILLYLQHLADQLTSAQDLPKNMPITVHYVDNETINAMATLGGHIIIFRGLLEKLNSENALAMVIAHEIAHIQHRHPIQTLSRGVVISIALQAIGITVGDTGNIIGSAGLLTALTFNRNQEQVSDFTALKTLEKYYGHTNGATDLFEILMAEDTNTTPHITFLSTHPLGEDRIQHILNFAKHEGWNQAGKLKPIPKYIRELIQRP